MVRTIVDKAVLFIASVLILLTKITTGYDVVYVLVGFALCGLTCYLEVRPGTLLEKILYLLYLGLCIPVWQLVPFMTVTLYSVFYRFKKDIKYLVPYILLHMALMGWYMYKSDGYVLWLLVCIFMVLSAFLGKRESDNHEYRKQIKKIRDDSVEYNNLLLGRNKYLESSMQNEVSIATLRERNRIAREIHDNAGHMITRSILQLGAIMTVNRNEKVYEQLVPLKESLDTAMNSLRSSVHDLHNESFDFSKTAKSIVDELKDFKVKFLCDITSNADRDVRYSFITILKEAVTNIIKHSNGNEVKVIISDLENYYQMLIEDNGTMSQNDSDNGIGIINMKTRIENLNGIFTVSKDKGFRIFISVPKKVGDSSEDNNIG